MLRVDAHLHVWQASSIETSPIMTPIPPQADVPIELAKEVLDEHHVDRAVLVQPAFLGEDNSYVADCARNEPDRFAAVCVVDPRVRGADARLQHWVQQGCRGLRLRPRIAEEAETFGDPATFPLWEAAGQLGVVVNLLSGPQHNQAIGALAERFPQVPIVIDHLGHPDVEAGLNHTGFQQLLALGKLEHVFIKFSGFYDISREPYPYRDCWRLADAIYNAFGPMRLLWGSDFPHVTAECSYGRSLDVLEEALGPCPEADAKCILGRNALRLYWPSNEGTSQSPGI